MGVEPISNVSVSAAIANINAAINLNAANNPNAGFSGQGAAEAAVKAPRGVASLSDAPEKTASAPNTVQDGGASSASYPALLIDPPSVLALATLPAAPAAPAAAAPSSQAIAAARTAAVANVIDQRRSAEIAREDTPGFSAANIQAAVQAIAAHGNPVIQSAPPSLAVRAEAAMAQDIAFAEQAVASGGLSLLI